MSTKLNQSKNQLLYFFILTFIFSWLLWLPGILYTYKLINPTPLILNIIGITNWIGGIGPSLIAFVLVFKNEGKAGAKKLFVRILQFKLGGWYFPIFLLIPFLLVLAHLINMIAYNADFPVTGLLKEPWFIPIVFLIFIILQFSEEFGWRGFALDRMQLTWNALTSSLILGVLWSLWHLPMFFSKGFSHYDFNLPFHQLLITFVVTSVLITWLQNNCNGSLIPAFIIHAMINFSGEILPLIKKSPEYQGNYTSWIIVNVLLVITLFIILKIWGYKTLMRKSNNLIDKGK